MLIFGFDPSLTNFGWVLCETRTAPAEDRIIAKGRFHTSSKQEEVDRFTDLRESLTGLLSEYPHVTRVATETPYFGDTYSEGLYALFIQVQQVVKESARDIVFLAPSQVHAFGRALLNRPSWWKWGKADSIETAKTFTDEKQFSNDEADAYLVAKMGSHFWDVLDGNMSVEELTDYERRAFTKVVNKRSGEVERPGLTYKEGSRFFRWHTANNEENDGTDEEEGD